MADFALNETIEAAFDWLLGQLSEALGEQSLPAEALEELSPTLSDLAVAVVANGGELDEATKAPFVARAHQVLRQFELVVKV